MTSSTDPEFEEAAEALLRRRLREHADLLVERLAAASSDPAGGSGGAGHLGRAALATVGTEGLGQHCARV